MHWKIVVSVTDCFPTREKKLAHESLKFYSYPGKRSFNFHGKKSGTFATEKTKKV